MGNNYDTSKLIIQKINELNLDLENRYFYINDNLISKIFEDNNFTKIKIPYRIDLKEMNRIINELNILNFEYKEIEENQKHKNLLTNSEMDILIYDSWQQYISFAPFLYGKISDIQVENNRQLIQKAIELYNKEN
jgi:hypothetical protein